MVGVLSVPSPAIHADERLHEADHPTSLVTRFGADPPLSLDCGINLSPFQIAYQTYGELNADRTNAILTCHALTRPACRQSASADRQARLVGNHRRPGRPLDTNSTSSSAPM